MTPTPDPTLAAQIEALAASHSSSLDIAARFRTLAPAIVTALRQAEVAPGVVDPRVPKGILRVIPVKDDAAGRYAVFNVILGDAIAICPDELLAQDIALAMTLPQALARQHEAREGVVRNLAFEMVRENFKPLPAAPATDVGEG